MVDVTVIVPLFNKEKFIEETIESVCLNQDVSVQIIIVDDNSTDNSYKVVESLKNKFEGLLLLKNDSKLKGGSVCRNIGLKHAIGAFIVFLDADDLLSKTCLVNRVSVMRAKPDLKFAVFPMGTFYTQVGDSKFIWNSFDGDHLKRFFSHDLPWAIPSPIWESTFLKDIGGFNELFSRLQDVEFHTRVLMQKPRYEVFSGVEPDCFYRIDEDRIETNQYDFLKRWSSGVDLYIQNFTTPANFKIIRGTYISYVSTVFFKLNEKKISSEEANEIVEKLNKKVLVKLFPGSEKGSLILRIYLFGLKKRWFKIKGYNFVFRKLLSK